MAHAEHQILIQRNAMDVYAFLADGTNNPSWRSGVVNIALSSGEAGRVGSTYAQTLKGPGGRSIAGDYQITVANPGKELAFAVTSGPARPTGTYLFEGADGATRLKFVLDFQPKGLARLMGPMIQKTMESEVGQLSKLKTVLEQ